MTHEDMPYTGALPPDRQPDFIRRITAGFGGNTQPTSAPPGSTEIEPWLTIPPVRPGGIVAQHKGPFLFEQTDPAQHDTIEWKGTLHEIVSSVEAAVADNSLVQNFWMPARLLRVILDHCPGEIGDIRAINQATTFLVELYAGKATPEQFTRLTESLGALGLRAANIRTYQEYDEPTIESTTPQLAQKAAERLCDKTDEPLLIIPLCHGGLIAGIQTTLAHQRLRPQHDTVLYPVRYSRFKWSDKRPNLSPYETAYLRNLAIGRQVVVVDEDAHSGVSVTNAMRHFADTLKALTIGLVNNDVRPAHIRRQQGEWWERF